MLKNKLRITYKISCQFLLTTFFIREYYSSWKKVMSKYIYAMRILVVNNHSLHTDHFQGLLT